MTHNTDTTPAKAHQDSKSGTIPDGWNLKTLDEIGNFFKGKGVSKSEILESTDVGHSCVRYAEIYTKYHNYTDVFESRINDESANNSNEIKYGDILFAGSGETLEDIGKAIAYLGNEKSYAGGDIIIFRQENEDSKYLGFLMNNDFVRSQLHKLGQGHSVVHIYGKSLKKVKIPIPPLPEQQKIAQILATWDVVISKQKSLIVEKQEQKKALMQQLLTGKKRFNGFEDEWEEKKLGNLGNTYSGLSGKTKEDFGNGKPYIPYMNIFKNSIIDDSYFDYVNVNNGEKQNRTKYGDLFFTVSSETPDEVGMASVLLSNIDELYLNSFCFGFRLNDFETLLPEFAAYYLRGVLFRKEMFKAAQGATRFNLSKGNVTKVVLLLPSIEEQQKIAEVLTAADNEIKSLQQQLQKLKKQKQGLMQQLLTGRIRVKI